MLFIACLLAPLVAPAANPSQDQGAWTQDESRKIEWFDGSWEELILAADASQELIFVELWSKWCPFCKKLDQITFRDKRVAAELGDMISFSADIQGRENLDLVRRFRPRPPTLIFLEPDGELREIFYGVYLPPEEFVREVQRIKRDEGTFTGLRRRIEKDTKDFEARYDLAFKLQNIGDLHGYKEQIEAIRNLDPEGKSTPARFIRFYELRKEAQAGLELDGLYAFLESETDSRILFLGWLTAWELEEHLAKIADDKQERAHHRRQEFAAAYSLWPHVPRDRWKSEGNNIAWSFYLNREHLSQKDLEWALGVARKVVEAAPRDAYVVDTLACCLHAVGKQKEAIDAVKRCIELEPFNPKWRERLVEFKH